MDKRGKIEARAADSHRQNESVNSKIRPPLCGGYPPQRDPKLSPSYRPMLPGPHLPGPQPVVPEKPKPKASRPGWLGGWI